MHELVHMYQDAKRIPLSWHETEGMAHLLEGHYTTWELEIDGEATPQALMTAYKKNEGKPLLSPQELLANRNQENRVHQATIWLSYNMRANRKENPQLRELFDYYITLSAVDGTLVMVDAKGDIVSQGLLDVIRSTLDVVIAQIKAIDLKDPKKVADLIDRIHKMRGEGQSDSKAKKKKEEPLQPGALAAQKEETLRQLRLLIPATPGFADSDQIKMLTDRYVLLTIDDQIYANLEKCLKENPAKIRLQVNTGDIFEAIQPLLRLNPYRYIKSGTGNGI